MPKENKTKYAILGLLSLAPMSGYDIKIITDNSIGHFWNENFGHIYPVLGRMEATAAHLPRGPAHAGTAGPIGLCAHRRGRIGAQRLAVIVSRKSSPRG